MDLDSIPFDRSSSATAPAVTNSWCLNKPQDEGLNFCHFYAVLLFRLTAFFTRLLLIILFFLSLTVSIILWASHSPFWQQQQKKQIRPSLSHSFAHFNSLFFEVKKKNNKWKISLILNGIFRFVLFCFIANLISMGLIKLCWMSWSHRSWPVWRRRREINNIHHTNHRRAYSKLPND